jgi:hypothetical protein
MSIARKTQNKSCTSSRDLINGVFRKIQGPYLITYEFSNMMMEKKPHTTQLRTAVCEPPYYTRLAHNFCCKVVIYVKEAGSFYFVLRAT